MRADLQLYFDLMGMIPASSVKHDSLRLMQDKNRHYDNLKEYLIFKKDENPEQLLKFIASTTLLGQLIDAQRGLIKSKQTKMRKFVINLFKNNKSATEVELRTLSCEI